MWVWRSEMGVKTNHTPKLEIEEFPTGILLVHKIFHSAKLRINAQITKRQIQTLIDSGWCVLRKPSSPRASKQRAESGRYRRPISDMEISDALEEAGE